MRRIAIAAAFALAAAAPASAAFINAPVPTNAYITFGGLDWAWANPCDAVGGCGNIDLSFQSTLGWRLPTAAELAGRPLASDFVFGGANVPLNGTDPVSGANFQAGSPGGAAACATPYFSNIFFHCDWSNGADGLIYNPEGQNGGFYETWVVRDASGVIPEPATWALMIAGFGLAGASLRRRSAATA